MSSVGIVIATYGDGWIRQHRDMFYRAIQSALSQTVPVDVVWEHGPTLAQARNRGARHVSGDRLVFLDADDWLDRDFAEKIVETEDVLQPLTTHWDYHGYKQDNPHYIEPCLELIDGNHIVVGAPVNRECFFDVGGFDDNWEILEDWALWLKMERAGATFGKTTALYNIQVRPRGTSRGSMPYGTAIEDIRGVYG